MVLLKFLPILLLPSAMISAAVVPEAELKIELHGDHVNIEPCITAAEGGSYGYELSVSKRGAAGSSNSRQSGTVTLTESQAACVGRVQVNLDADTRLSLSLDLFFRDEKVLSLTRQYPSP